jgi:hypothetical protein
VKSWVKVLLGLVAGILVLMGLAAALLVRSGRWQQIQRLAGGILEMKRGTEGLERLQREHPYTPSADGLIAESRLSAYLEICESLQPLIKPYEAWIEAHAGRQGDFQDAAEALQFMGKITAQAAAVLRAKGMTPQELAWIHRAVRKAMEEVQEMAASPVVLELMDDLRRVVADPGISNALKEELRRKLERHDAKAPAKDTPLSPNARLCRAHAARIRRADLGDFATLILEGAAQGKRRAKR